MGVLQTAYRTFESAAHLSGVAETGKEPLTPVSHLPQNAQIEITINASGEFVGAKAIPKADAKTIIPVTLESGNRTGDNTRAHPISDQLRYLASFGEGKHAAYLEQLQAWANSEFSHPKVQAILRYITGGTIIRDLAAAEVVAVDESGALTNGKIETIEYAKCLVRWRVAQFEPTAAWADQSLFESFIAYYNATCAGAPRAICMISGEEDMLCDMHPKGVLASNNSAKLISANDSSGFTYRGRFKQSEQAYSVGYAASQKVHSALRWIAANDGVYMGDNKGGRTFICWNPEGFVVPPPAYLTMTYDDKSDSPSITSYKLQLSKSIEGYKLALPPEKEIIIAAIDAATTGRLSITYYNELRASDFFDRLEHWYNTFCWISYGAVRSISLREIINLAFGSERDTAKGKYVQADGNVIREHVQRLVSCVTEKQHLPLDIIRALTAKASNPMAYRVVESPPNSGKYLRINYYRVLTAACAALRKYYFDKTNKEVWELKLDVTSTNRSYLFGRLLAVAELAEGQTFTDSDDNRETSAQRLMSTFSRRPNSTWQIIRERLNPYLTKLGKSPARRKFYVKLIDEIMEHIDWNDPDLDKPLDPVYLIGYSHQRNAIFEKNKSKNKEENQNESAE